jgi:hypothetical protein
LVTGEAHEGSQDKYLARANLAQQLRSIMTVTLHPDRSIVLRFRGVGITLRPDMEAELRLKQMVACASLILSRRSRSLIINQAGWR